MTQNKPAGRPLVSVIMGMFNCAHMLDACVDSLLAQTYDNWELVMCDDGSNDDTLAIARGWAHQHPSRITLLENARNMGLSYSLNKCIAAARGELLARQDADDLSEPDRFEKQVAFLLAHPELGWVGTATTVFNEKGVIGIRQCPRSPQARGLVKGPTFTHGTVMMRANMLRDIGGYKVSFYTLRSQDYDLWMRLYGAGFRGANLDEPLYRVREDAAAYTRRRFKYHLHEAVIRFVGYRAIHAPLYSYLYALKPVVLGSLPRSILQAAHNAKLKAFRRLDRSSGPAP